MAGQTWTHYTLVNERGQPVGAEFAGIKVAPGEVIPWSKARKAPEGTMPAAVEETAGEK